MIELCRAVKLKNNMSMTTNIPWCDSTANIIIGCSKVSEGCKNCFAMIDTPARVLRHRGIETWGERGQRVEVKGYEKTVMAMNAKPWICYKCGVALSSPALHDAPVYEEDGKTVKGYIHRYDDSSAKFHRRRIFHGSNNDWLDNKWPVELLAKKLEVIRRATECVHILCTKRPENFLPRMISVRDSLKLETEPSLYNDTLRGWLTRWIQNVISPQNIILLTSVENQEQADKRIPELRKIPAACRGLSLEPLLGPVEIKDFILPTVEQVQDIYAGRKIRSNIEWLIIGGESGPHARPCNVEWLRALVQQGKAAGVATFVKQLGANCITDESTPDSWPPGTELETNEACSEDALVKLRDKKGGDSDEWPEDLRVREFPVL
jgi:protein gp37